jgi:signal transduction histidine kinase
VSALPRIFPRTGAPLGPDAALAALLALAGLLEVLVGPGGDGSRTISAAAVAAATLPLAWRRTRPLLPLAAIAIALIAQALLGGFLVGETVTPLVALVIALYSAGRHVEGASGLAAAAAGVVVIAATRVAADPAADTPGHAVLTLVAASMPLLVGRWVHGQELLQRQLALRAQRLERDRERDARHAAEEERVSIAGDLQAAIAGGLHEIVRQAHELPRRLEDGDPAAARAMLASIAATARGALGDVRRIVGILRRDGQPPRLTPPAADPLAGIRDGRPGSPVPSEAPAGGEERGGLRAWLRAFGAPATPALDRLLVAALVAGAEVELASVVPAGDRPVAALTGVVIAVPLLWRRRHPVVVGAAVLAAVSAQSALLDLDAFPLSDIGAVVAASYAIGAHAERRTAVAGLALALLGAAAHAAIFYPDGVVAALLGGVTLPWTVGRVVRGHRLLTRQRQAEAARAELARAAEARAAVTEERMRVARELHDAVAHNISVIAIQAGGADGIVERDPERAARCAALIESVAREALGELDRLVSTMGAGDSGPAVPQPSLARVDALAARARNAGVPVELDVEGEPAALPAGVDLAAYRIVQEALANTAKHAGRARARVVVRYRPDAIEVEIADDGGPSRGAPSRGTGGGHGLIGIRERVALYDGTLDVGRRPSGGFLVHARLPIGDA